MDKEKLIAKWLNGELSADEQRQFEQLEDFDLNEKIIAGAEQFKASHFSKARSYTAFKEDLSKKSKTSQVIRLNGYRTLLRIAAMIAITLGVYFTFFSDPLRSFQAMPGEQQTVVLPDASTVILNAGSDLNFRKRKWDKNRAVNLTGEAYFDVAKGSTFDVVTAQGVISVLGTQFSVNQRGQFFEVNCYEGLVQVSANSTTLKLRPGQSYRILNGSVTQLTLEEAQPDWLTNKSMFKSVPYAIVIEELERQYKISIIKRNINADRIFTGGFVHENLDEALKSITVPLDITYQKQSENTITLQPKR